MTVDDAAELSLRLRRADVKRDAAGLTLAIGGTPFQSLQTFHLRPEVVLPVRPTAVAGAK